MSCLIRITIDESVALISAGTHYRVFEKLYATAKDKIKEINIGRIAYPERLIRAQQNIGSLMRGVLTYYQYHRLPNAELISTLTTALSPPGSVPAIEGAATTATLGGAAPSALLCAPITSTNTISKASLIGYQATSALIGLDRNGGVISLPPLYGAVLEPFKLMRRPAYDKFLSPMQRHIFTHFLERNEKWLTIPASLHITWLFWEKWHKFRALYLRVHAVYEGLYSPEAEALKGVELQLVDELLSSAMSYYYHLYQDACLSIYEFPMVNPDVIIQDGQEVGTCVVHVADYLLSYANRDLIEKATAHQRIAVTKDAIISARDDTILRKDSEIVALSRGARYAGAKSTVIGVGDFFYHPRAGQNDVGAASSPSPGLKY